MNELVELIRHLIEPGTQYLLYLLAAFVIVMLLFIYRATKKYILGIGVDLEKSIGQRLGEVESGIRERISGLQRTSANIKDVVRQGIQEELGSGLVDVVGNFSEQVKNQSQQTAAEVKNMQEELDGVKALLEKQSVYIHDSLAESAAKGEDRAREIQDRLSVLNDIKQLIENPPAQAVSDDEKMRRLQDGVSARLAEQGREERALIQKSLEMSATLVSESMNRLSAEMDAKLTQLVEKAGDNFADRLAQTVESFGTLQTQMNALIEANKDMESMGKDITSLSRLMMVRSGRMQETQVSDLLSAWLPDDTYALNVRLNDMTVSALLYLPGNEGAIAIDAELALPDMDAWLQDSGDTKTQAARQHFGEMLIERIRYVAETHIAPPTTNDSALLFIASEAVFAEIQAHQREALDFAASRRVWLTSPTTFAAALNIARTAIRDHQGQQRLQKMQAALQGIVQEAQQFESRLLEIGDHVNNAMRSVQRAESAGVKLFGRVRGAVSEEGEPVAVIADKTMNEVA